MLLLCKQKDDVYRLEIHLQNGSNSSTTPLLKLGSFKSGSESVLSSLQSLVKNLNSNRVGDDDALNLPHERSDSENSNISKSSVSSFSNIQSGSSISTNSFPGTPQSNYSSEYEYLSFRSKLSSAKSEKLSITPKNFDFRPATVGIFKNTELEKTTLYKPLLKLDKQVPYHPKITENSNENQYKPKLKDEITEKIESFDKSDKGKNKVSDQYNSLLRVQSEDKIIDTLNETTIFKPNFKPSKKTDNNEKIEIVQTSPISKIKCTSCNKQLRFATSFTCRCGFMFCSVHRYSDRHPCNFNFQKAGRDELTKQNPMLKPEKVYKI